MLRIEQLYAFIALDPADDTEGLVATRQHGVWTPLVGADMKRVDSLRPAAEQIGKLSGTPITVCRFEIRTDLDVIQP